MSFINYNAINEIHIELSSRCQLKCLHCSSNRIITENKTGYSISQLKPFLSKFNEKGCHVYITGGEPLLSPKIYELITLCKELGFSVGLFTTFNVNEDVNTVLQKLKDCGLSDFYLSLYGSNAPLHDYITGVKGSYDKSIQAVKAAKNYNIDAKINFVLLKTNLSNLSEILKDLDRLNCAEIRILKLVKHGSAVENWDKIGVEEGEQVDKVISVYQNEKSYKTKLTFSGFPTITQCRPFKSDFKCGACKTLLYVDNYGDVYPCASQKNAESRKVGSIFTPDKIEYLSNACCVKNSIKAYICLK